MIKKIFFAILTILATHCSHAEWTGDYQYIHDISMANADKQYRVEENDDTLTFKKNKTKTWDFELFTIARSANMCDIAGEAKQISTNLLEYKGDDDCTLQFENKDNKIHVKDVGEKCEKQCGFGVYLNGLVFSPKPKETMEPRQATSLRKVSKKTFQKLKGNWKETITEAYIHRSTLFHEVEFDKLQWYQTKKKDNKYYLFSDDQPFFIILNHEQKSWWEFINIWRIDYPENTYSDGQDWGIYPALYPISDYQDAIALTYRVNESYSGGGVGLDFAKIIPLEISESVLDASQAIIKAMPFSCSKSIRSCFSEEEYNKFGDINNESRCHDESSGYLTLKTQHSSSNNNYQWRLTWNESFLKGLSDEPLKKTKQRVVVNLNKKPRASCETFNEFNFCGGGQEDHCPDNETE